MSEKPAVITARPT